MGGCAGWSSSRAQAHRSHSGVALSSPERLEELIFMSPASMHNLRQTNSPARRGIQQLLKTEQQFLAAGSVKLSIFKTILKKKYPNKGDSVVYVTFL